MSKKSEALRLADCLDDVAYTTRSQTIQAAAELRRLHEVNAELVEALSLIYATCENVHHPRKDRHSFEVECPVVARINALKAQGDNNDT